MSTNYDERPEQERIWNYNRANRFKSIKEYFEEDVGDFDSFDIDCSAIVTCVEPDSFKIHPGDEYYDRFTYYVYENVNVVGEETDEYVVVCDWSAFFYKHYDTFKEFARKNWSRNSDLAAHDSYDPLKDADLCYEWIMEIGGFLAGYTSEPRYKELYEMLKADDEKPECERYKLFYAKEIAPHRNDPEPEKIRKEREYSQLTYDYISGDFQSGVIGCGYPVMLAVNTREGYAFVVPYDRVKDGFEEGYNNALAECREFGKKPCTSANDFNRLAYSLADKSDFRDYLEIGDDDLDFEIITPSNGGRK